MDTADAFQIVLNLARKAIDFGMSTGIDAVEASEACDILEDIAINEYGDE